jgi:nitroreductase
VVRNRELIDRMSEISKEAMLTSTNEMFVAMAQSPGFHVLYHAPAVLLISGRKDALSSLVDCSAAVQNMLLAAESLELGTCWIGLVRGFFSRPDEVAKLNLPEGYGPLYAVTLGYPDVPPCGGPDRKAPPVLYID